MVVNFLDLVANFFELENGKEAAKVLGLSVVGTFIAFGAMYLMASINIMG